ncbi:MAG: DUF4430 domain-containing protein [Candidatus Paceibacterota bacterium]
MTSFISFITASILAFTGALGFGSHTLVIAPSLSATTTSTTSAAARTKTSIDTKAEVTPAPRQAATLTVAGVSYEISADTTVYEAMRTLAANNAFRFTGENYPSLGFFVESIDSKKNSNGYYWILYVNGKSADLGASSIQVHSGDTIEWRYAKSY